MGTEIGEWAPTLGSLLKGLGSLGGTLALRGVGCSQTDTRTSCLIWSASEETGVTL